MQEKYGEISEKRDWRKLHVSVDQYNIIQTSVLTHRRTYDVTVVDSLVEPLPNNVSQVTADTAYDSNDVYTSLSNAFFNVDVVIPPRNDSVDHKKNHWMRNRNIRKIQCYGRMHWQSSFQAEVFLELV